MKPPVKTACFAFLGQISQWTRNKLTLYLQGFKKEGVCGSGLFYRPGPSVKAVNVTPTNIKKKKNPNHTLTHTQAQTYSQQCHSVRTRRCLN